MASKIHGKYGLVRCIPTPLKNMKVNGKGDIPYMKWKIEFIEGTLEVKFPTIWTDEKQSREEAERRERLEERRVEEKE